MKTYISNNIDKNRAQFVAHLLKESKVLYPAINFTDFLLEQTKDDPRSTGVYPLLTEKEYLPVQEVALQKLKEASEDGTLIAHHKLFILLIWWEKFGGKSEVSDLVSELLKNKSDVANLLASAVTTVYSYQVNGLSSTKRKVNRNHFDTLIPREILEKIVEDISKDEKESMDERQKEAIHLYRST